MKICSVCGIDIGNKTTKGLCNKHFQVAYYAINIERKRAYFAAYRTAHPEKTLAADRAYKKRNKKSIQEKNAQWRKENHSKINEKSKQRYVENRELLLVKAKAYRSINGNKVRAATRKWRMVYGATYRAENRELLRSYQSAYKSRKRGAEGRHTGEEIKILFEKQKGCCAVCKISLPTNYHKDHVIALINGGSNWIENIQLLCPSCNCSKKAKDPIEFMQSRGFLL